MDILLKNSLVDSLKTGLEVVLVGVLKTEKISSDNFLGKQRETGPLIY